MSGPTWRQLFDQIDPETIYGNSDGAIEGYVDPDRGKTLTERLAFDLGTDIAILQGTLAGLDEPLDRYSDGLVDTLDGVRHSAERRAEAYARALSRYSRWESKA